MQTRKQPWQVSASALLQGAFLLLMVTLLAACGKEKEVVREYAFRLDLSAPEQQKILDLQDRQIRDSLLLYFGHPDPSLRYRAVLAFGSYRDSSVVPQLARLLGDDEPHVRAAAAYAMGQTGARSAAPLLIRGFRQRDSLPGGVLTNAAILEAVGKTGGSEELQAMSTVTTYRPTDSLLILAQARGIYRFALRGITTPAGTERMVSIVADQAMPPQARLMAANYFLRATGIATSEFLDQLGRLAESDADPRIRMCLVVGVAKSRTPQGRQLLARILLRDQDYRVKCNILRALQYYSYAEVRELAFQHVESKSVHIARCAAQYLLDFGEERDAARYRSISRGQLPWEVKTVLYAAANRYLTNAYAITKGNLNAELDNWYRRSMNPYEKAAVLNAYAQDAGNYLHIADMSFKDEYAPVRTAGVEAFGTILSSKYLSRDLGGRVASVKREITGSLVKAIQTNDPAMVAAAASILSDREKGLYEYAREHLESLESALIALDLPKDIEAYDALAECLANLKKEKYVRETVPYNHPIDWTAVDALPDTVHVEVKTSRGSFRMDLYTAHAPGTVLNFVRLARDQFYQGKNFHRVVPNFVIQGGCPRGDGYGSLDYTIRSELSPSYYDEEGCVGMASAGNHTEGTQWFVTHSPTPHLDGNYTLFGRITDGIQVVHAIQIGDEIQNINIL